MSVQGPINPFEPPPPPLQPKAPSSKGGGEQKKIQEVTQAKLPSSSAPVTGKPKSAAPTKKPQLAPLFEKKIATAPAAVISPPQEEVRRRGASPTTKSSAAAINSRSVKEVIPFGINASTLSPQGLARFIAITISAKNLSSSDEQLTSVLKDFKYEGKAAEEIKELVKKNLENPQELGYSIFLDVEKSDEKDWRPLAELLLNKANEAIGKERDGQSVDLQERKHLLITYLSRLFAESLLPYPADQFNNAMLKLFNATASIVQQRFGNKPILTPQEQEKFKGSVNHHYHALSADERMRITLLASSAIAVAQAKTSQGADLYPHLLKTLASYELMAYPQQQNSSVKEFEKLMIDVLQKHGFEAEDLEMLLPIYIKVERALLELNAVPSETKEQFARKLLQQGFPGDPAAADLFLSELKNIGINF